MCKIGLLTLGLFDYLSKILLVLSNIFKIERFVLDFRSFDNNFSNKLKYVP